MHRHLQTSFNCSEVDTTQWDSDERKIESEANTFASYLLMPADDYRRQIQGTAIDLDVLGACADRYGVSMTSAILKWLELTPQRAVLVMSQNGIVQWACGSESGKWLSMHLNKRLANGQRRPLPARSATRLGTDTNVDRLGTPIDASIWFPQEPEGMVAREMRIASDFYRQTMTLLVLPPEVKPWEREKMDDDDDGLENTFDRFVRNGQPPVR